MAATTDGKKRTSYLELFFDLVFVFAITQLSASLRSDHTLSGWMHAALVLWLVWWAWSQFTWAGNAIDLDRRPVRFIVLVLTGLTLVAAIAIPEAFTGEAFWFAIPYSVVRLAALALYWHGLRDNEEHRAALMTYLPVALVGPLLVLIGGFVPASVRPWIWAVAVAVDVTSAIAGGRGEFRIAPAHFAERHALFVIIALGECVIAVGVTAAELPETGRLVATAAIAFCVIASLWWSYFDWVHSAAEERLTDEKDPRLRSHLARDLFTFGYLPIVGGTVAFAVGVEEVLAHPDASLDAFGLTAIATGLVLFLAGFVAGNARARHALLVERTAALVAVLVIVPLAGPRISALALLAVLAVLMVAVAAVETARHSNPAVSA